jgi:hypothetical protein
MRFPQRDEVVVRRRQARISRKLHDRNEKVPQAIRDIAWKAQLRLSPVL